MDGQRYHGHRDFAMHGRSGYGLLATAPVPSPKRSSQPTELRSSLADADIAADLLNCVRILDALRRGIDCARPTPTQRLPGTCAMVGGRGL